MRLLQLQVSVTLRVRSTSLPRHAGDGPTISQDTLATVVKREVCATLATDETTPECSIIVAT